MTSPEVVVERCRITVIHEVAHHFGIDEDRLHELGLGLTRVRDELGWR